MRQPRAECCHFTPSGLAQLQSSPWWDRHLLVSCILSARRRVALQEKTPGPEAIRGAPVAGMILPRTSWFLPQRCLRGVLVLLPCSSRRVRDSGDANQGPAKTKQREKSSWNWCFSLFMAEFGPCPGCWSPLHQDRSGNAGRVTPACAGGRWCVPGLWGSLGTPRGAQRAQRATQHGRLSSCAGAVPAGLSLASDTVFL